MSQEIRSTNCPFCSSIIDVVSPLIDAKAVFVTNRKKAGYFFSATEIEVACPDCLRSFVVYWYYK